MSGVWDVVWPALAGLAGGVLLLWALLVVVLWRQRSAVISARDAFRFLPDVVRLVHRLTRDATLPRSVRIRLWVLLAYLASPIDLVPDFIPVVGYADDVIVVAITLRSLVRAAGVEALERHWPGSADGLAALQRLFKFRRADAWR